MNENEKYNFSGKTDCMCGSLSNSGTFLCDSRKIFLEFQQLKREFFRKFYDAYSSEEWNPNEILIVCKFTVWRTRGKIYKAKHNSIESLSLPQCAMPSSFSLWNARFLCCCCSGWLVQFHQFQHNRISSQKYENCGTFISHNKLDFFTSHRELWK